MIRKLITAVLFIIIIYFMAMATVDGERRKKAIYEHFKATANLNHVYTTTK
jgi:hypothetical protein